MNTFDTPSLFSGLKIKLELKKNFLSHICKNIKHFEIMEIKKLNDRGENRHFLAIGSFKIYPSCFSNDINY